MARTVSAFDVAKYILDRIGHPISQLKLQKLLYYCQAWSLVWDGAPLFHERIEAWINGPVVPAIWMAHRYERTISKIEGNAKRLDQENVETVELVLETYGSMSAWELVHLTHQEDPWKASQITCSSNDIHSPEIDCENMRKYYRSIQEQ